MPIDGRSYTYDRTGNVLTTDKSGPGSFDEKFAYDGLDRLVAYERGTLSSGSIASPVFQQTWTLDALGNWRGFTQTNNNATLLPGVPSFTQARTANAVNEITALTGGGFAATAYDAAGNLTSGPKTGDVATTVHSVYDGWNGGPPQATPRERRATTVHSVYDGWNRLTSFARGAERPFDRLGRCRRRHADRCVEVRIVHQTASLTGLLAHA